MRRSDLIHDSDKKKRFTEAYIVRMTTCLIRAVEKETWCWDEGSKWALETEKAQKESI